MRRLLYPAIVAAALGLPLAGAFPAQAASYAGHWKATLVASCQDSKANAKLCGYVLGSFAVLGKTGTTITETGTDNYTVAANGTFTDVQTEKLTVSAPGAKTHSCPSASKLQSVLFSATCSASATGKGRITIRGGQPVFYYDSQTFYYQGKLLGTLKGAQANTGLPSPAKPGIYGAAWAAQHAHVSPVPSGFSFQGVITRSK
jgi:hypothetical protein